MVLHWIANPGPSGLPGSIPGAGVSHSLGVGVFLENYKTIGELF